MLHVRQLGAMLRVATYLSWRHCSWREMASVSMLGGIGFTVSLFIATITFGKDPSQSLLLNEAKLGIVTGSVGAGIIGFLWLQRTFPKGEAPDTVEME